MEKDPAELFNELARPYLGWPDVTTGTGFGGNLGLRRGGRIFAMLVRGNLVVKISRDQAARLVAAGDGTHFDPGHGRLMREWVEVSVSRAGAWPDLMADAFRYAAPRG